MRFRECDDIATSQIGEYRAEREGASEDENEVATAVFVVGRCEGWGHGRTGDPFEADDVGVDEVPGGDAEDGVVDPFDGGTRARR